MTPEEYKQAISDLGLTHKQLAEELGITQDAIIKRKAGRSNIKREPELAILYLLEKKNAKND